MKCFIIMNICRSAAEYEFPILKINNSSIKVKLIFLLF